LKVVIDSSVAVKWFVREVGHEAAKALLASGGDSFIAPDFMLAEVANVLWRKVRQNEIEVEQVQEAIRALPVDVLVSAADLVEPAFDLARQIGHSVYDCLFLACALKVEGSALVIADEKVAVKMEAAGFGDRIRRLSGDSSKPILQPGVQAAEAEKR
jgi:predicted nucleic acid-binding protein